MARYLVIVESPTKVKTIKKFLGSNYVVMASNGHVRDLPKSQMGVDLEHDFEPKYITIRGKGEILAGLRKEVKKADKIYLATDPDREGEAISWHLMKALKLEGKKVYRISFNEITKSAVKASLKNARDIDMDLVDAQQARRVLDRIVGYKISPVLWAKVKRGLSAGRVQSVALRIIADREDEIASFIPEEYWSLDANFKIKGEKKPLTAKFYGTKDEKITIHNEEELNKILAELEDAEYKVVDVKRGERSKKAPLPFTTSTLQQEASKALNFATSKTMRIAQQLYEGVDIKGSGTVGLITYLRTDSTRISEEADANARAYVGKAYGEEYVAETASEQKQKNDGKNIQDAHEAIRPSDVTRVPAEIKESLTRDQFRLYQLIWKRFVASRMQPAKYETTSVKIGADDYRFTVSASKIVFEGFRLAYVESDEEKQSGNVMVKSIDKDSELTKESFDYKQHFTQPPAHYTEASLVKTLEELGIGRPSTYAPTISTIIARRYVAKENKNLYMTELGEVVNNIMKQSFTSIVDVNFTAYMEGLLDMIAEGKVEWKSVISNFYPDLNEAVEKAEKELETVKIEDEVTDVVCEECGRNMVIKYGPHGKFLACPGFPECRNTKPYLEKIGVACPKCGKDIVLRKTKKGRRYYGCEDNPECDFMSWQKPSEEKCPKCGSYMVEKGNKLVCGNEQCGFVKNSDEEKQSGNVMVKSIDKDSELTKESFDYKQHFTQPPAHYTEASLVKTLEELGIGRPSTYAPTISTIIARRYVAKENKNLYMTELGEVVNNIMKQSFTSIVDVNFTAYMEGLLDMIAEGKVEWKSVISNFYPDLNEAVEKAEKELETVKIEDEVTDVVCEECGRNMVIKYGPHGKFLACPGFPECRNTKPYLEKIGVACPKCGKDIVLRKTKKGRRYYGCEDNPECDFMSWQKPSEEKCPKCGSYMVEKGNKLVCGNEQCGFVKNKEKDEK